MPSTDQAQVPLQALFAQLDALRALLKTVEANFKVSAGPLTVSLAPGDVAALKTQYTQLLSQMDENIKRFPDASAYFP
jgi:hypothetical protein